MGLPDKRRFRPAGKRQRVPWQRRGSALDGDRPAPFCGPAPLPGTWAGAWTLEPVLLGGLALSWLVGLWWLRAAGAERQRAFGVAAAGAVVAFVSPLCALTVALFAARSLHHMVLILLVAPALAVAFPWRRAPLGAGFIALSAALWAWHLPALYAAAWDSAAVYWAMQLALLGSGWVFWTATLGRRGELSVVLGAAGAATGLAAQMGLIGAILVFAPTVLYPEHLVGAEGFGFGALADQQLAGLVMWVPGMLPLALAAGWMLRQGWREAGAG